MNWPHYNIALKLGCAAFLLLSILECESVITDSLSYAWHPPFSHVECVIEQQPDNLIFTKPVAGICQTRPTAFINQPSFLQDGYHDRCPQTGFVSDQLILNPLPPDRCIIRVLRKQTNLHRASEESSPHSA